MWAAFCDADAQIPEETGPSIIDYVCDIIGTMEHNEDATNQFRFFYSLIIELMPRHLVESRIQDLCLMHRGEFHELVLSEGTANCENRVPSSFLKWARPDRDRQDLRNEYRGLPAYLGTMRPP